MPRLPTSLWRSPRQLVNSTTQLANSAAGISERGVAGVARSGANPHSFQLIAADARQLGRGEEMGGPPSPGGTPHVPSCVGRVVWRGFHSSRPVRVEEKDKEKEKDTARKRVSSDDPSQV